VSQASRGSRVVGNVTFMVLASVPNLVAALHAGSRKPGSESAGAITPYRRSSLGFLGFQRLGTWRHLARRGRARFRRERTEKALCSPFEAIPVPRA